MWLWRNCTVRRRSLCQWSSALLQRVLSFWLSWLASLLCAGNNETVLRVFILLTSQSVLASSSTIEGGPNKKEDIPNFVEYWLATLQGISDPYCQAVLSARTDCLSAGQLWLAAHHRSAVATAAAASCSREPRRLPACLEYCQTSSAITDPLFFTCDSRNCYSAS